MSLRAPFQVDLPTGAIPKNPVGHGGLSHPSVEREVEMSGVNHSTLVEHASPASGSSSDNEAYPDNARGHSGRHLELATRIPVAVEQDLR